MQIYDFESSQPPALNENLLRLELARRRQHRQILLLVIASALFVVAALLLGWYALDWYPELTALCVGYAGVTALSYGIAAVIWVRKGCPGL